MSQDMNEENLNDFDPKRWSEFGEEDGYGWVRRCGGVPVACLASHDRSESYEMDRAHVFKIRPGRYVLITECGCSCYDPRDASIYVYPSKAAAMKDFESWKNPGPRAELTGILSE